VLGGDGCFWGGDIRREGEDGGAEPCIEFMSAA
jgi:hypothetical protein